MSPEDGECRRLPPSNETSRWVCTKPHEWCGEHPERVRRRVINELGAQEAFQTIKELSRATIDHQPSKQLPSPQPRGDV